jgi:hypothetical protein
MIRQFLTSHIRLIDLPNDVALAVFDISGAKVYSELAVTFGIEKYIKEVNIATLQNGIYVCHVLINGTNYTRKIIVNHQK